MEVGSNYTKRNRGRNSWKNVGSNHFFDWSLGEKVFWACRTKNPPLVGCLGLGKFSELPLGIGKFSELVQIWTKRSPDLDFFGLDFEEVQIKEVFDLDFFDQNVQIKEVFKNIFWFQIFRYFYSIKSQTNIILWHKHNFKYKIFCNSFNLTMNIKFRAFVFELNPNLANLFLLQNVASCCLHS